MICSRPVKPITVSGLRNLWGLYSKVMSRVIRISVLSFEMSLGNGNKKIVYEFINSDNVYLHIKYKKMQDDSKAIADGRKPKLQIEHEELEF